MPGDSSLKTAGRWRAVKRLLSASVITVLEVQLDGDSFSAGLVHTEHSRSVDINIYIYSIYILYKLHTWLHIFKSSQLGLEQSDMRNQSGCCNVTELRD